MYDPRQESDTPGPGEALGQSEAFLNFQEQLSRVAQVERPVLIVGERGTGKELAARRVHFLSKRWQEPLVELNCSALAPTLIESELFGHEPGAFTGAQGRRRGRFEMANGGTLFLDELGNIPMQVQEKILRAVEYGCFERVGGTEAVRVDVRIVGATNADLPRMAEEGRFMRDLLDRLSFEVLFAPPLRARKEDIMILAAHFAARMTAELGRDYMPEFADDCIAALEAHPWHGNIRELKNTIERAVFRTNGPNIDACLFDPFASPYDDMPACPLPDISLPRADLPFEEYMRQTELSLLRDALAQSKGNQRKAATRLQLTYDQFRGLYKKHRNALG